MSPQRSWCSYRQMPLRGDVCVASPIFSTTERRGELVAEGGIGGGGQHFLMICLAGGWLLINSISSYSPLGALMCCPGYAVALHHIRCECEQGFFSAPQTAATLGIIVNTHIFSSGLHQNTDRHTLFRIR